VSPELHTQNIIHIQIGAVLKCVRCSRYRLRKR